MHRTSPTPSRGSPIASPLLKRKSPPSPSVSSRSEGALAVSASKSVQDGDRMATANHRVPARTPTPPPRGRPRAATVSQEPSDDDYKKGIVVCGTCGEGIPFRDPQTGGFTLKLWDHHREQCRSVNAPQPEPIIFTPETTADALTNPPQKKRRAKRTEDERIEYLRSDPYVAAFEPYRVHCKSCDRWIRLRPNSTYCSIPWDAHRKSCLSKKANSQAASASERRNALLSADSDARKFDVERIMCVRCDAWIPIRTGVKEGDETVEDSLRDWYSHKLECRIKGSSTPQLSFRQVLPHRTSTTSTSTSKSMQSPAAVSSAPASPAVNASHNANAASFAARRAQGEVASGTPSQSAPSRSSLHSSLSTSVSSSGVGVVNGHWKGNEKFSLPPISALSSPAGTPGLSGTPSSTGESSLSSDIGQTGRQPVGHSAGTVYRIYGDAGSSSSPSLSYSRSPPNIPASLAYSKASVNANFSYADGNGRGHPYGQSNGGGAGAGAESRRRSAVQREAALREDPLLREVEASRVFCTLCTKWVQLRQDSSFCAYPWLQHRGKCLKRHHRKMIKTQSTGQYIPGPSKSTQQPNGNVNDARHGHQDSDDEGMTDQLEPESEDGAARNQKRSGYPFPQMNGKTAYSTNGHTNGASSGSANGLVGRHTSASVSASMDDDEDLDAEGELDDEGDFVMPTAESPKVHHRTGHSHNISPPMGHSHSHSHHHHNHSHNHAHNPSHSHSHPHGSRSDQHRLSNGSSHGRSNGSYARPHVSPSLVDLDSNSGRINFIVQSVRYLFKTTFERTDELSVVSLVNYLNAAMPTDKYEDFDLPEVSKAVASLKEHGVLCLQGDVVKLLA